MNVLRSLKRRFGLFQHVVYITGGFDLFISCDVLIWSKFYTGKAHAKPDLKLSDARLLLG